MNAGALHALLQKLRDGDVGVDDAVCALRQANDGQVGDMAQLDLARAQRVGAPEIVYGESKSAEQIALLMEALDQGGEGALATRVSASKAEDVVRRLGRGRYEAGSRTLQLEPANPREAGRGVVAVVCAGTSDLGVADEAAACLQFLGHETMRICDIGVAGLHRLLRALPELEKCSVLIVVAGMEGALPTVVAGLLPQPVIAVPSSVGYGVSAGGFAALCGMLSSCAPGLAVVNIDNGIGAAMMAARINRKDS